MYRSGEKSAYVYCTLIVKEIVAKFVSKKRQAAMLFGRKLPGTITI